MDLTIVVVVRGVNHRIPVQGSGLPPHLQMGAPVRLHLGYQVVSDRYNVRVVGRVSRNQYA